MTASHVNLPIHAGWNDMIINKHDYPDVKCYTIEKWRDGRLCKQPLNCLANNLAQDKLRGGKNV